MIWLEFQNIGNFKSRKFSRNDLVITECHRRKIIEDSDGRSVLQLNPANEFDLGIYKVVARNKFGQTIARTRYAGTSTLQNVTTLLPPPLLV